MVPRAAGSLLKITRARGIFYTAVSYRFVLAHTRLLKSCSKSETQHGTSTVALLLKNKSIINSNSLRGNIHTEKSRNRKRLDGTCWLPLISLSPSLLPECGPWVWLRSSPPHANPHHPSRCPRAPPSPIKTSFGAPSPIKTRAPPSPIKTYGGGGPGILIVTPCTYLL